MTNRRHVRTKAGKKHQFLLSSQAEQLRALRYMGAEMSRIDIPMLHNDHIKWAACTLMELADCLGEIASRKNQTAVNRIFDARVAVYYARKVLRQYASDDIKGVRDNNHWNYD